MFRDKVENKKKYTKKPSKKKSSLKFAEDRKVTSNTTKDKTFATNEETFQFNDHKTSTRTTHYNSKRDYLDRMEVNKLSPFSSPNASKSPTFRKSYSPIVVKDKKKVKKYKTVTSKKNSVPEIKSSRRAGENQIKTAFQNQFIKRMNKVQEIAHKKITELSEEQIQTSIPKHHQEIFQEKKSQIIIVKKSKGRVIKDMLIKIKQKYKKMYPNLKASELKLLSTVVLLQRLWRQNKVKKMIGQFLSPNSHCLSKGYTFGRNSNIITEANHNNTMKTEKSLLSIEQNKIITIQDDESKNESSFGSPTFKQEHSSQKQRTVDLQSLEVSGEFNSQPSQNRMKQMIRYVDCYREVMLKSKREKKKKVKENAFNFPSSLSEKCLLEKLYRNTYKVTPTKQNLLDFFPHNTHQKSKQLSKPSPKKPEVVELEERFYTEAQDQQYHKDEKVQSHQKQPLKPEQQTIGNIGNISEVVIGILVNQFAEEFGAFSKKKCLKKKKKLPGITVNEGTIGQYVKNFLLFIKQNYAGYLEKSFTQITPESFLKVCRYQPEEELFERDEDEEDYDWEILPSSSFFKYQAIYEEKFFCIKEQNVKYENFLSGLIKIHNKCLSDCIAEMLEKERIDSIIFPWESCAPYDENRSKQKIFENVEKMEDRIKKISKVRLGRLYRKDFELEEACLLLQIGEQYKREGKEWKQHSQLLELKLELSEVVAECLFEELANELSYL